MRTAFETASSADPRLTIRRRYRLAGCHVVLTIAGKALADRIARTLRHLEENDTATGPVDLHIDLWDGEETGVPSPVSYLRDVFYRSWPFGRNVLASSADEDRLGFQTREATTILDRRANRIVGFASSHHRLSLFELGKPLQPLLFAWFSARDLVPVHAGLVSRGGQGILLGGAGGSGKTTTSLLCARAEFAYLGDDYIVVPPANGSGHRGYSLYNSTWLEPEHVRRFPWLEDRVVRGTEHEDKWLVVLSGVEGLHMAPDAPLQALALPKVAGTAETRWSRASRAEALRRLAPSSILQLPFIVPGPAFERMTELVQSIPAYRLELGTDLERIPDRVAEILDDAGRR
ncbi:MAG: hypothetical protein ACREMK_06660 [Gemmatimonadota bacterium]